MRYLFILLIFITFLACSEAGQKKKEDIRSCTSVADCLSGEQCIDNICKTETHNDNCETDTDCLESEICIDSTCIVRCGNNSDCLDGYYCDVNGVCKEDFCVDNSECETGEVCVNGTCVDKPCENNNDCELGFKCDETGRCVELGEEDCRYYPDVCEMGYECDHATGFCKPSLYCASDDECAEGFHCNEGVGECVEDIGCTSNEDCDDGQLCENSVCVAYSGCLTDDDCTEDGKPACNVASGECYECTDDIHCDDGFRCDTYVQQCIPEGDPCENITCSGHGDCIEVDDRATCDCDEGYRAEGLNCIHAGCEVDQFSSVSPINNSPETAADLTPGTYSLLATQDGLCQYQEDWYKINIESGKTANIIITFDQSVADLDLYLYSLNDTSWPLQKDENFGSSATIQYGSAGEYYLKVSNGVNDYSLTYTLR